MTSESWSPLPGVPRCKIWDLHRQGIYLERKFRLFLCGGCRTLWNRLPDAETCRAVEVAERYAEGDASADELADANRAVLELSGRIGREVDEVDATLPHARNFEHY